MDIILIPGTSKRKESTELLRDSLGEWLGYSSRHAERARHCCTLIKIQTNWKQGQLILSVLKTKSQKEGNIRRNEGLWLVTRGIFGSGWVFWSHIPTLNQAQSSGDSNCQTNLGLRLFFTSKNPPLFLKGAVIDCRHVHWRDSDLSLCLICIFETHFIARSMSETV